MTLTQHPTTLPDTVRFRRLYSELNVHEQSMYSDLREDVLEARRHSKWFFGLFDCPGWFFYVIMPEGIEFHRGLASRRKFESHLKLDPEHGVDLDTIGRLLKVLAAEGLARIERLTPCMDAVFVGVPETCYEYAIDTRSQ